MTNEQLIIVLKSKMDMIEGAIRQFKKDHPTMEVSMKGVFGSQTNVFPCLDEFQKIAEGIEKELELLAGAQL